MMFYTVMLPSIYSLPDAVGIVSIFVDPGLASSTKSQVEIQVSYLIDSFPIRFALMGCRPTISFTDYILFR